MPLVMRAMSKATTTMPTTENTPATAPLLVKNDFEAWLPAEVCTGAAPRVLELNWVEVEVMVTPPVLIGVVGNTGAVVDVDVDVGGMLVLLVEVEVEEIEVEEEVEEEVLVELVEVPVEVEVLVLLVLMDVEVVVVDVVVLDVVVSLVDVEPGPVLIPVGKPVGMLPGFPAMSYQATAISISS
ncbi:hypothetical protein CPB84DRAFT_1783793 [Gymnopilus junonius]|uniref:Uncharacterized protein n=1 Tax=Gymnopilus junonius TaxID=109634 RepID=A0A9P5TLD2_GYMJU|nr:hypothetical protein CPB84DRAFT_1783793 [Gymnopilus junonius]